VETGNVRRIVIVDDDRALRDRLQQVLERAGYTVSQAPSGLRLLSLLEVDRPDLVLLDVAMSWIDGFELCRALKANKTYSAIPVVFISGRSSDHDVKTGLGCGAADYFVKPLDTQALVDRIMQLLPATD
jgi:DNA-binding response OmpR family regulator